MKSSTKHAPNKGSLAELRSFIKCYETEIIVVVAVLTLIATVVVGLI